MAERLAIDGVGRVHYLTDNELREDTLCGYLGTLVRVAEETLLGGYRCPQCEVVHDVGPGTVVVQRGDSGSALP